MTAAVNKQTESLEVDSLRWVKPVWSKPSEQESKQRRKLVQLYPYRMSDFDPYLIDELSFDPVTFI